MASTFVIDTAATFAAALLMSAAPKTKFGTTAQDVSATGVPKWTVEAAVTFHAENGMRPTSEVIAVTITSPGDPGQGIAPGTPVIFDGFRVGNSPPERTERGVRGGKFWYQASGIRSAIGSRQKAEAAA